MAESMKLAPAVILIDVAFLNSVIADLNHVFSTQLRRDLDKIQMSSLITYLALDARFPKAEKEAGQALLIYDEMSAHIPCACPSDVQIQLNGVAFQSTLGEFSLYAFPPAEITGREEFFVESVRYIASDKGVRHFAVIADMQQPEKARTIYEALSQCQTETEVTVFSMTPAPDNAPMGIRHELLGYPVMHALGIRGNEI